jgi:hypothetical protein
MEGCYFTYEHGRKSLLHTVSSLSAPRIFRSGRKADNVTAERGHVTLTDLTVVSLEQPIDVCRGGGGGAEIGKD